VPLRVRLTLWFASVTTIAIVALSLSVYAEHGRTLYRELDRSLYDIARSFGGGVGTPDAVSYSPVASPDLDTLVRLYGPTGVPIGPTRTTLAPPLDALGVLARNDGPASDAFLRRLPGARFEVTGGYATTNDPETGRRLRLYALPVVRSGELLGYVETWNSLSDEDQSTARLRGLLIGLDGGVMLVVWLGGVAAAGLALRPLRAVTLTARHIANSGRIGQRVPLITRSGELGELTATFNEMLEVLERSHESQRRFVADAAHELRAPLAAIAGNAELLEREVPLNARGEEAVQQLRAATSRLAHVVSQLLALARLDAGEENEIGDVELDAVVLEASATAGAVLAGRRIDIRAIQPVVVRGDRRAIEQVLLILLDNAAKHGEGTISVALTESSTSAQVCISDEGPGIPPGDVPHVFDRFYRGARAREDDPEGSGLGLAIAQTLIERQGGAIKIESSRVGTQLCVSIPMVSRRSP
jgi:two-component system, OmpR family, sensor kinase